jgi:imidazoleglycerol phosphate dehydratase HisB
MEIAAKATKVKDIRIQVKVIEDKDGNRDILTQVSFLTNTDPDVFTPVLQALTNHHNVDVTFASEQLAMNV